jgi:hypothetical protein
MRKVETCIYHPDRTASKKCKECGAPLCKYCKDYCKDHERNSTRGVYQFN